MAFYWVRDFFSNFLSPAQISSLPRSLSFLPGSDCMAARTLYLLPCTCPYLPEFCCPVCCLLPGGQTHPIEALYGWPVGFPEVCTDPAALWAVARPSRVCPQAARRSVWPRQPSRVCPEVTPGLAVVQNPHRYACSRLPKGAGGGPNPAWKKRGADQREWGCPRCFSCCPVDCGNCPWR